MRVRSVTRRQRRLALTGAGELEAPGLGRGVVEDALQALEVAHRGPADAGDDRAGGDPLLPRGLAVGLDADDHHAGLGARAVEGPVIGDRAEQHAPPAEPLALPRDGAGGDLALLERDGDRPRS